jgi:penicillin amidase
MKKTRSIFKVLLRRGHSRLQGKVCGLPLSAPVEIFRDETGIPHIFARNESDLMMAQGFVHAQDRLWQMEAIRRITTGTLAEIAGEEAADMDVFSRLAGFNIMVERALKSLSEKDEKLCGSYVTGINTFVRTAGRALPLEFRFLKFTPAPWRIADIGGSLAVNAWFLQTNYQQELLAALSRKTFTIQQWNEMFPSYPGEKLPEEDFFSRSKDLKIGKILPHALAFYPELSVLSGGSNNWVAAKAEGELPLIANDPHLGNMLPQIWYFCHLHCPTLNVCGSSLPGSPGVILGRNDHIAWGTTNIMTDIVDLFIIRVDPQNPTRYFVKGGVYEMEPEDVTVHLTGGTQRATTIYRTIHGPVITALGKGIDAAVALKWYGTLEDGVLKDSTLPGFFTLMRAKSVEEAFEACRVITMVGQNIVVGDVHGNIGWHTTGAVPVRKGYSGWLPADGSSGLHSWAGFLSPEKMPHVLNPAENYIVTANNKITGSECLHPISYSWCAPYRFERIVSLIKQMGKPSVEDFRKVQLDSLSLQAERTLPVILGYSYSDPRAQEAAGILRGWDCRITSGSVEALVFNVFLVKFARLLLGDVLGEGIQLFLSLMPYLYTVVDDLLFSGDRTGSRESGLLKGRSLQAICENSLSLTISFLSETLGSRRNKWSWGRLHTYHFKHPGAKSRLVSWLLNRGPYPAPGNATTVNQAAFNPACQGKIRDRYEASIVPSFRMISSLCDPDKTFIIGPMGQSGQPGDKHYDDMIDRWLAGDLVQIPLTRKAVERIAVNKLELFPAA